MTMQSSALLKQLVDHGFTQAELAERLATTQPSISRWMEGSRQPSGPAKRLIAELAAESGIGATPTMGSSAAPQHGAKPHGADLNADLYQVFADVLKADEPVKRRALFALRDALRGQARS